MSLSKNCWLSRVIIFLFGVLLILVAFPFFCRFMAAALESGHMSNIFAGATGVFFSLFGFPLMVIALGRRQPRLVLFELEENNIIRCLIAFALIAAPGQFAWYLFHEAFIPRYGDTLLNGGCTPLLFVMLASAAVSLSSAWALAMVFIIEPLRLRKSSA